MVVVAVYLLSWGDSEEATGTETLVRLVGTEDIDGLSPNHRQILPSSQNAALLQLPLSFHI